jgi:hypothetical protein
MMLPGGNVGGAAAGYPPPNPASASPTAGIWPMTLEQLLNIFNQSMARPRKQTPNLLSVNYPARLRR